MKNTRVDAIGKLETTIGAAALDNEVTSDYARPGESSNLKRYMWYAGIGLVTAAATTAALVVYANRALLWGGFYGGGPL